MSRVKSGKVTHARHKKVLKAAKGYYAARSRNFRTATQAVDKANQYATRDRKARKRSSARCGSSGSTPPSGCSMPR
jgi:large subunit ribosomal protein L20